MPLKPNQEKAIKKLEAAFLACKRAGLVTGCEEDHLMAAPYDSALVQYASAHDMIHALLHHPDEIQVKTYGMFFGGGAA